MFTVCPKCALTLVVTAADLKVAQGYVRCGRCSNVFNAIAALTDERQAPEGFEGYVEPEPPPAEAPEDKEDKEEKLEFDPTSTNVSDVFVEPQIGDDEATGTFEAIVLESSEPDATEPEVEPEQEQEQVANPDEELEHELQSLAERIEAERHLPTSAATLPSPAAAQPSPLEDEELDEETASHSWLWRAGIAALLLTLIIQALHHYRHDLAAIPQLSTPIASIYHAIGVSLVPRWDVAAYEVRQLGATTSPSNERALVVRASIKNGAHQPQPLPLLRVAVQDRFGNRIAARDVVPESYAVRNARRLLGSGERIDVEMQFVDPGESAVGFEIDACLAAPGGGVNCANR